MPRSPAKGKGIGGPAKGEGRGGKRVNNWTAEEAKAMSQKAVAARRDRAEATREARAKWNAEHPEFGGCMSDKQITDYMRLGAGPILDKLEAIALDDEHPKQAEVGLKWIEQIKGKPKQAVELSGPDGKPVQIDAVDPVEAARQYQEIMKDG